MAGFRGLQPDASKGKKNEWSIDTNGDPVKDPTFARMVEAVDEQSDVSRWLRNNQGTFDSADLSHLQETQSAARAAEARIQHTEREVFEALRAREAEREQGERERARARAAAAAAAATAAAAKAKPKPAVVAVRRAGAAAGGGGGAGAAGGAMSAEKRPADAPDSGAKRARTDADAPQPTAEQPAAALAGLLAYSDSDDSQ